MNTSGVVNLDIDFSSVLVKPSFNKKELLNSLGFRKNARLDKVLPCITDQILARKNNDDSLAAKWSEVKEYLKKDLFRSCNKCGACISRKSLYCVACCPRNRTNRKVADYIPKNSLTQSITNWILSRKYFFLDELLYWTSQQQTKLSQSEIYSCVKGVVRALKRYSKIKGGGHYNYQRYERI